MDRVGKIHVNPGTEEQIDITGDDNLVNFKIEDDCYVNDTFLGSTVTKKITVDIINPNNEIELENKEISAETGILINGKEEIIPFGNYIIQKPDSEEVKEKTTFTGYDYMNKFDTTYIDDGIYPIRLYDKLNNLCKQIGIELGTKEIINGDYMVLGNPFTNNETCKTVLSNIAQLACGFAKIGRDNKLYIVTLANKENVIETLDANCYMDDFSKNDTWGEVNSLIIRLSQVEGENTTIQDEDSIQKNGLTEVTISDNYFLKDSVEREKVIQAIWDNIKGLKYLPFSTTYYGFPYLDVGDMIKIYDTKDNEYISYVFNHEFTYNGSFSGTLETKALTKTQTALKNTNTIKTKFRNVEYKVDKIEGKISSIIEQQDEHEEKLTKVEQDVDSIKQNVKDVIDYKRTVENVSELHLTDAGNCEILKLEIKGNKEFVSELYPRTNLFPRANLQPNQKGG